MKSQQTFGSELMRCEVSLRLPAQPPPPPPPPPQQQQQHEAEPTACRKSGKAPNVYLTIFIRPLIPHSPCTFLSSSLSSSPLVSASTCQPSRLISMPALRVVFTKTYTLAPRFQGLFRRVPFLSFRVGMCPFVVTSSFSTFQVSLGGFLDIDVKVRACAPHYHIASPPLSTCSANLLSPHTPA
jgi:hypothetical protein